MTNHPSTTAVRRAARVLALVPAILVTSATGSAFAEAPEQWEDNGPVSPLHVILVLVVIPVALFALICAAGLPALDEEGPAATSPASRGATSPSGSAARAAASSAADGSDAAAVGRAATDATPSRTGEAQVAGGDAFSSSQRHEIDKAIRDAETLCRFEFSVFVGRADGESRPFAERLHAALVAPDRSVLVLVDPAAKQLEIVTGAADPPGARRRPGRAGRADHAERVRRRRPGRRDHPGRAPARRARAPPAGPARLTRTTPSTTKGRTRRVRPFVMCLRVRRRRPGRPARGRCRPGPRRLAAWPPGSRASVSSQASTRSRVARLVSARGNMYSSIVEAIWVPWSSQIVSATARYFSR